MLGIFKIGFSNSLPGLASNLDPPDLCLQLARILGVSPAYTPLKRSDHLSVLLSWGPDSNINFGKDKPHLNKSNLKSKQIGCLVTPILQINVWQCCDVKPGLDSKGSCCSQVKFRDPMTGDGSILK
jgi:hypothetical protein